MPSRKNLALSCFFFASVLVFSGLLSTATAQATAGDWTWMGGPGPAGSGGGATGFSYGWLPPGRLGATSWTDSSGNFWLYGGTGIKLYGGTADLNDLLEFSPSANTWTVIGVPDNWPSGQCGDSVYGTLGTPAAGNSPGSRHGAVGWTDANDHLWLFGGVCGVAEDLRFNDLWEFNPSTSEWTWMGGSGITNQSGVYGTLGFPDSSNIPGARYSAASWSDNNGNFWLFGGWGNTANTTFGPINDLWELNPSTGEWTWFGGGETIEQPGVYGTSGVPAAGNMPGARYSASSWTDKSGNFWLFGGAGIDASDAPGKPNDLWEFNPDTDEWAWMGGSNTASATAVYGTLGVPAPENTPGGLWGATTWTDRSGNLWLFGGVHFSCGGCTSAPQPYYLNDLWEFTPSTMEWAWMGGSGTAGCYPQGCDPVYGRLGTPADENIPGGLAFSQSWADTNGNLWLFGGIGPGAVGAYYAGTYQDVGGILNNLWRYQPTTATVLPAATPTFSVATGTYTSTQTVAIGDTTPFATIYYTTDGTTPTASSTVYSGAISVSSSLLSTETISAIATAGGYSTSAVATAVYTIIPPAAAPTFSVAAGAYASTQTVTISDATPGATIYYTTDGTRPKTSSNLYSTPVIVSASETLEAIATATNYSVSAVASAGYLITPLAIGSRFDWTWMGGSSAGAGCGVLGLNECGPPGVYGTLGVPAAGNIPGGRYGAATWTDGSGNLWLFGGQGDDADRISGWLNDLWKFNPATNEWDWVGGNNTLPCNPGECGVPGVGVYGTLGVPAAGNIPGGRSQSVGWIDNSGNLWLFGGDGYDSRGSQDVLNDLWEFNLSANEWAWMGGSSTVGPCGIPGVYGTLGKPAAGNVPGARYQAASWTDRSGNFWLFGGRQGYGGADPCGQFNDLWEFNPTTNEWAWISGSNMLSQSGLYGALGTPVAANVPGARYAASSWSDSSGHLWLFGGVGYDASGHNGNLNDLWEFDPATEQWAWMGGSNMLGQSGVYGTLAKPATGNIPGGRNAASNWIDSRGNFWLFGGAGYDANGNEGDLNDLWEFNPSTNTWAWMSGSSTISCRTTGCGQPGVYGTLGTQAAGYTPGGRSFAQSWSDTNGNLWLLGGSGYDANGDASGLNDVWRYQPPTATVPPAATPNFSVAAGTYTSTQTVTISDATPFAVIYYTTDGVTIPSVSSTVYQGPITVLATETIQAFAIAPGYIASSFVSLTYTIPPDFSLASSPVSMTLTAGQSATASISLTPKGGFHSPVSFACSGLPARASCTFAPATVTPAGSSASTALTISTAATRAYLYRRRRPFVPMTAIVCTLVCLRFGKRRHLRMLMLLALGVAGLSLLSACGGSSGSTSAGGSSSQPVISIITVTATSGSLQHTATISLTVN